MNIFALLDLMTSVGIITIANKTSGTSFLMIFLKYKVLLVVLYLLHSAN